MVWIYFATPISFVDRGTINLVWGDYEWGKCDSM